MLLASGTGPTLAAPQTLLIGPGSAIRAPPRLSLHVEVCWVLTMTLFEDPSSLAK